MAIKNVYRCFISPAIGYSITRTFKASRTIKATFVATCPGRNTNALQDSKAATQTINGSAVLCTRCQLAHTATTQSPHEHDPASKRHRTFSCRRTLGSPKKQHPVYTRQQLNRDPMNTFCWNCQSHDKRKQREEDGKAEGGRVESCWAQDRGGWHVTAASKKKWKSAGLSQTLP